VGLIGGMQQSHLKMFKCDLNRRNWPSIVEFVAFRSDKVPAGITVEVVDAELQVLKLPGCKRLHLGFSPS